MLGHIGNKQKWMIATIVASSVILNGCTGGGGSVKGTTSANPSPISVAAVFPTSQGVTWSPIVVSNRYYIGGLEITINGSCDRGIATIFVNEGGPNYPESANCQADGSFSWSKIYVGPLDVDKTLQLAGYDTTNTFITGTASSVNVHIDNVPPTAPVVTTPAGSTFTITGASGNLTLVGTNSVDTNVLTVNGSNLSFTGTNWTYPVDLVDGTTVAYTFYAYDLAGNQSTGTTVTITYAPSLRLGENVDLDVSGGNILDTGSDASGFHLEAAVFMNHSTTIDSGTSGFFLDTGFNYITNSERAN